MRKNVSVFTHDANEMVDPPSYRITCQEADIRIEQGYAVWLTPSSIRTKPPGWTPNEERFIAGGVFQAAWKPRWSDGYLVLQMVPRDEERPGSVDVPGRVSD
jgi:hypothetical protein